MASQGGTRDPSRLFGAVVRAILLLGLARPAGAQEHAARRSTPEQSGRLQRLKANHRERTQVLELDWIHHQHPEIGEATTIRDTRVGDTILRTRMTDGVIDPSKTSLIEGGRFKRTVVHSLFEVKPGERPWSDADIPHMFVRGRQGVKYDHAGGKTALRLFMPDATRVRAVIEGDPAAIDLDPVSSGVWEVHLARGPPELYGKEYHFEVTHTDGTVERVADPFADSTEARTERGVHRVVSRFADLRYTWHDQEFKRPSLQDIVVYEAHMGSLSRHPSSGAAPQDRGTYRGARARRVVDHLKRLKVAVEFLPLHAFDKLLGGDWGYASTSYRALTEAYMRPAERVRTPREVMELVDAYHQNDIPVIFDVVYNHGGELHVRALGQDIMQRRLPDGTFDEGSGVGPTVRSEHPVVRSMILDTLKEIQATYHVDGFRFDLGALLDKRTILDIDKSLPRDVYLFAEPWALSGQKWGKDDMRTTFRNTRWVVWNDDFREPVKDFITGKIQGSATRDRLKTAILGAFPWAARPQQSASYFVIHDGPTAADLVGGSRERAFQGVVLTLMSQGIPMLLGGTEFMYSKGGEDNTWNRADLNVLNWDDATRNQDLVASVADLIAIRKALPQFKYKEPPQEGRDIDFIYPNGYPHEDHPNALGFVLKPPPGQTAPRGYGELMVMSNGGSDGVHFYVPPGKWKVIADGKDLKVDPRGIPGRAVKDGDYYVHPGTAVVLARDP